MIRFMSLALLATTAACLDASAVAGQQTESLTFKHPDETITTACDPQCDADAKVLTLRYQSAILLNSDLRDDYDWLLRKARFASPVLCTVTATAASDPQSIIVQPIGDSAGAIIAAWNVGIITTGVSSIDSPLATIGVNSVGPANLYDLYVYVVSLKQAVNVVALANTLNATGEVRAFIYDYTDPVTNDITATRQSSATLLSFIGRNTGTTNVTITDDGAVTSE